MFAKITLNKNAILVAYTLRSDVACASTTLKHSCAADFYVMLCGMRALTVIEHFSLLLQSEVFTCYCSVSCPCCLLFVLLNSNAFLFPNWTFCSDHDQWTWLRERKLQKQEDSEGEVSCLSETEWYFYCSSGCKWIREVIKGLQFILCVPLWEWSDLHINKAKVVESKMWRRVLATVNYLFHLSCVWLSFANIDGTDVSITFYHWF